MNIGLFGITANPVHLGHLNAANYASELLDEIWISPVYKHPFGKEFIAYEHRKKMLSIMFKKYGNKNIVLKELDKDFYLEHNEMIYSYLLLNDVSKKNPGNNFKLIIGEDNYKPEVWSKFKYNQDIERDYGVVCVPDKGSHSSEIRPMILNGDSIEHLVSKEVEDYIKENKLYG